MAAATAYCPSNAAFHQHSLSTTRSQFTPVSRRTTLSPSTSYSSNVLISHKEQASVVSTIKSDENNNCQQIENTTIPNLDDVLYITSDEDADDDERTRNDIDEEEFLALIGLRPKTKEFIAPKLTVRPLTKRLACPVCLLPLPKYLERVRQALYIRLPFLKFLSITYDTESYCSTDDNAKAQSLLPRSNAQTRSLSILNKTPKKQRSPKTEFISLATNAFRNTKTKTSVSKDVHSVLQCQVVLDRLEQSTIDDIIQNSTEDDTKSSETLSTLDQSLCTTSSKTDCSLSIATKETLTTTTTTRTTITTMTKEKTVVKRKSTKSEVIQPKRFKSIDHNTSITNENDSQIGLISSAYERIYLKCTVCSKREYIDGEATNSDVLHSHWLEHDGDLSLNIYDSEIDSILTRVVEFYKLPKQYMLEGKVKTVFILNSKEIRCTSTNNLSTNDSCIVID